MTQGQSKTTRCKAEKLRHLLHSSFIRGPQGITDRPHFHFDLNCGSGWNAWEGCVGSPLVFLDSAKENGVNFYAYFIDTSEKAISLLRQHPTVIEAGERCRVWKANNRTFIARIPALIRRAGANPMTAVGSVLIDPNGTDVPVEELARLAQECPKLDIIVNWNTAIWKFTRVSRKNPNTLDLAGFMTRLGRKNWVLSRPFPGCRYQFSLIAGRNHTSRHYSPEAGLVPYDSQEGRDLHRFLNYTRRELKEA